MAIELDYMEYANDAAAQAAYVSSDVYGSALKYWSKLEDADDITSPQVGPSGTVDGSPTYAACKFNNGVYVNTTNEGYYFSNNPTTISGAKGVVEFWVKTDYNVVNGVPSDSVQHWFVHYSPVGNQQMVFYFHQTGGLRLWRTDNNATTVYIGDTTTDWTAGDLVHLAFVWDKDAGFDSTKTMAIYVNGVETISTTTALETFTDSTVNVYVGEQNTGVNPIDSLLDNLKIWNVGRTDFSGKDTENPPIGGVQSYSESTLKQQGSYSLKGIARITDSLNDTLTRTVSPTIDLSEQTKIKFYAWALRTGSNFKVKVHDVGGMTTEYTVVISSAETWEQKEVDISAVADADKDAIDQIIIEIINADSANTIYIDNMYAEKAGARSFGIIIG